MPKSQNLTALQTFYSSQIEVKGDVSLFIGCMGELVDFETVNSAIQVLTRVGFNVHIPITQTCCGALSLHAGDKNMFEQLKITNLRAFEDDKFQTIISIASGCGSALREYDNQKFAEKIIDINHFLIKQSIDFNFLFKPLKKIVCLHTPCSLKNVLKTDKSVSMLLQKIPELEIINLPETQQCCGAAGSYVLKHHEFSNTLVTELIDNVVEKNPDYLVSSNVGCALHISATLREQNNQLEIIHPVVLLARQLTFCQ